MRPASVLALVLLTLSIWFEVASAQTYTLTLTVEQNGGAPNYVAIYPGGDACLGDGSGKVCVRTYPAGTALTISVNGVAGGYVFAGWSGVCTGTSTTCNLTMDSDKAVTATFSPTVTVSVTGNGTVTSTPAGINCGTTCNAPFPYNSQVTLTASPADGYAFSGWSGDCSGLSTCTLTMSAPKNVTAAFVPLHTLTTTVVGAGGFVNNMIIHNDTYNYAVGSCINTCVWHEPEGSQLTMYMNFSTSGWVFTGWSGDCAGQGFTCVLTLNGDKSVTAIVSPTLTVSLTGSGSVTSTPAGINCGSTCNAPFPVDSPVTLTATPTSGYVFSGWSGDCSGTGTCNLTMNAPKNVTATFTQAVRTPALGTFGLSSLLACLALTGNRLLRRRK